MRYKLTIEYDGRPFSGWQRLPSALSVQGALEDAVEKLTGMRGDVTGAGRTDSGVHACGQVAHVDIDKAFAPQRLADALNAHLRPHPISVLAAEQVAPEFHARFDAVRRSYLYRIVNRRAPLALDAGKAWRVPRALDLDTMREAAQRLVGRHDFTTFRDSHCQAKSPVKTLDRVEVICSAEALCSPVNGGANHCAQVHLHFSAQSFLHRQVRSMVGTLVEVGLGKMTADEVSDALAAADRKRCGPVASADGLYLMRVDY